MKPSEFSYVVPDTVQEALALLRDGDEGAKLLAGGQSLVPVLNLRLARPSLLIDLGRIPELRRLKHRADGALVAGAMTRHRDFELSPLVRESLPIVYAAMPSVAHVQIRNRGTIGGSLSHADPSAEWPALCVACEATFTLHSVNGVRSVDAEAFNLGLYTTALRQNEMLTEIAFPPWSVNRRWGFQELSRRRGDFAIVGVACVIDTDELGRSVAARIVLFGASDRPILVREAADVLIGRVPSNNVIRDAARVVAATVSTRSDLHASAAYRTELAEVLSRRALQQAFPRLAEAA